MDISNNIKTEIPKITYITPIIQDRYRKKRCDCKPRNLIVDVENREILCDKCGCIIDPFNALWDMAKDFEVFDTYLSSRYNYAQSLEIWFKNNRIPMEIKRFVEDYRARAYNGLLPECPHCGKNFNYSDIKIFSNPSFR